MITNITAGLVAVIYLCTFVSDSIRSQRDKAAEPTKSVEGTENMGDYGSFPFLELIHDSQPLLDENVIGDMSVLDFVCLNKYSIKYGEAGKDYPYLSLPYVKLVEPYEPTLLRAVVPATTRNLEETEELSNNVSYVWILDDVEFLGSEITILLKETGYKTITLSMMNGSSLISSITNILAIRYVRREIRQLFEDDREAYLQASETVYRLSTEAGR